MKLFRVFSIALIVGAAWVFFEWLFFVTKPSFMSLYTLWEKLGVLAITALIVTAVLCLLTVPFAAVAWLLRHWKVNPTVVSLAALFPSTLFLATAMLVIVDNFSLTVFGWGIRNSAGAAIYLYRVASLLLLFLAARWLFRLLNDPGADSTRKAMSLAAGLVLAASIPLLLPAIGKSTVETVYESQRPLMLPNILVVSGDGIASNHMSLYGYERPTTPFLNDIRSELLVAENHFSNASDTGGSVISLLTGKLPTTTKVIYPPDVLRGSDSFQHLPGILRKLGYYTADISMRHYADPYDLNLRNGFSEANFRNLAETGGPLVATIRRIPSLNPSSLMIDRITERAAERLRHVWRDTPMQDPLAEVNTPDRRWITDEMRLDEIRRIINEAPRPFFVNVHTMGTHGELFRPSQRVYSTEDDYPVPWSIDGYDDAIMDFDRHVEQIYRMLADAGILESTVLIISSDHGFNHNGLERLPMLLRLPGAGRNGTIGGNTQRLDIAPTLLDILGIGRPDWMEGRSMLEPVSADFERQTVFATGSSGDKAVVDDRWRIKTPTPPWYSLGRLFLIHCNQGFVLHLADMTIQGGRIEGSTMACTSALSLDQAREIMLAHLLDKGYSW